MRGSDVLMPETMLAASAARTGLSDFGDPGFREGFDLLLSDVRALELADEYAGASAYRIGISLDARARAIAGLKARPELLAEPIKQPIIIAGLVRSGTTALHLLMSLDPQFQGPEHWLTSVPMPRPPRASWDGIPEYRAIAEGIAAFIAAAPEMADDHMMSAEGIEESLNILATGFASNMWPSMWNVPNYDRWYRGRDDSDSYLWMADVLRLIGGGDGRRWLLKNPTDLFSMREVLNVFPDAMIIQTHRDPVDAMPSISSLIFAARRIFCGDKASRADVGRREMEVWAQALERAEQVRKTCANGFYDIEFGDFTRDQIGTVKAVYDHFGLTLSAETELAMKAWLDAHPRRSGGGPKHRAEDYGLTPQGLRDRFADYRGQRGYA